MIESCDIGPVIYTAMEPEETGILKVKKWKDKLR